MRIFQSSLPNNRGGVIVQPPPIDTIAPLAISNLMLFDNASSNEFVNLQPSAPFPTVNLEYRPLTTNEVRVLFLFGHSDMMGNAQNWEQYVNPLQANDWATPSEVADNPNCLVWTNNTWAVMHHQQSDADPITQNVVSNQKAHGRELQFKAHFEDYFDAGHSEKLHIVKAVSPYMFSLTEFIYGGEDWKGMMLNQVRPALANLLAAGKVPVVHFVLDMLVTDYILARSNSGYNNFVFKGIQYSLQKAFNMNAANVNITLRMSNPADITHPYALANKSALLAVSQYPNFTLGYGSKEGSPSRYPGDEHGGYTTFKDVAHGFTNRSFTGTGGTMVVSRKGQLQSIADQPVIRVTQNIPASFPATVIFFNKASYPYPDTTQLELTMDVPFDAEVFADGLKGRVDNVTYLAADIGSYEVGFIVIENDLTGVTRFEFGNQGYWFENFFIEKYKSTLSYIDIRGSRFSPAPDGQVGDSNKVLAIIVSGGVNNGTLLISGATYGITSAAQANYDTLISRGWTIDIARP